jgi:hypothetical protein
MAFCHSCGGQMRGDATFCENCGRTVTPFVQQPIFPVQPHAEAYSTPYHGQAYIPYYPGNIAPSGSARRLAIFRYLPWGISAILAAILLLVAFTAGPAKQAYDDKIVKAEDEVIDKTTKQIRAIDDIARVVEVDKSLFVLTMTAMRQTTGDPDEKLSRQAELIRNYVSEGRNTTMDSCPKDFVDAYGRSLSLWSDVADLLSTHPHIPSEDEALVTGILHSMIGDASASAFQQQEIGSWQQQLNTGLKRAADGAKEFSDVATADLDAAGKEKVSPK